MQGVAVKGQIIKAGAGTFDNLLIAEGGLEDRPEDGLESDIEERRSTIEDKNAMNVA